MRKDHATISIAATAAAVTVLCYTQYKQKEKQREQQLLQESSSSASSLPAAYESLIGNTPLIKLERLSNLLKRNIWVKMESMNPGATGKDRAALGMIQRAEKEGWLPSPITGQSSSNNNLESLKLKVEVPTTTSNSEDPMAMIIHQACQQSRSGGIVVEGTSGSTGIALATLSVSRGHACLVVLPDDQASEKKAILKALGAIVYVVPTASISNPNHYVNIARRLAEQAQSINIQAVFMNQFENAANFDQHYQVTGPEIWKQFHRKQMQIQIQSNSNNKISLLLSWRPWRKQPSQQHHHHQLDAFVMSAGTGGTISGIGKYLKEQSSSAHHHDTPSCCRIVLVDPPGSSLYNKIKHGVAFAPQQREQTLQRHRYDTIAEGIGLDRVTHNLSLGLDYVDDAVQVSDQEALDMAHYLLKLEGLWIGSSSAMNVVGAIRTARALEPGANVVTIICDSGSRHVTRMWNPDFVTNWGLEWPGVNNNQNNKADDGSSSTNNNGKRIPECLVGVQ